MAQADWKTWQGGVLIAFVMTTDLFLPVPSSAVAVYAGGALGVMMGTLACWLGLTAGCGIGYELARLCGRLLPNWLISPQETQRVAVVQQTLNHNDNEVQKFPWWLAVLRPLPLLAEASVFYAGLTKVSRRPFYLLIASSNGVLSLAYAICGKLAKAEQAMGWALVASLLIPLLGTAWFRYWSHRPEHAVKRADMAD